MRDNDTFGSTLARAAVLVAVVVAAQAIFAGAAAAQGRLCGNVQTQAALNDCSLRSAEAADDELNRIWKIVKPRADARGTGQQLLESQRAWLGYRDATCEAERASYGQGSFAPTAYALCIERLTLARNAELLALQ